MKHIYNLHIYIYIYIKLLQILKKPWRLTKAIGKMKSDAEQKNEIGVAVQSWP